MEVLGETVENLGEHGSEGDVDKEGDISEEDVDEDEEKIQPTIRRLGTC